jgi:murein DD-endopeptidase MepM/ murein hydrolase activator NlpD
VLLLIPISLSCMSPESTGRPPGNPVGDRDTAVDTGGGDTRGGGLHIQAVDRGRALPEFDGVGAAVGGRPPVGSPFGPRVMALEDGRSDFHLGVDIPLETGTPVVSVAKGTVFKVSPEDLEMGSGNQVYVEHLLDEPFTWEGVEVTRYYTFYQHLESYIVSDGAVVEKGTVLGRSGTSGANSPHLHLEVRLQTHCSLHYRTENPDSTCGIEGFDPHVNPLALSDGSAPGGIKVRARSLEPFVLEVTLGVDDLDLNRIESDLGVVDFNSREGLDASTLNALDDLDYGWMRIEPLELEDDVAIYLLYFAQAPSWVEVTDLHGVGVRASAL